MHWHTLSQADTLKKIKSDAKTGLTESEAKKRLLHFGLNTLPKEKKLGIGTLLLHQIQNIMVVMLLIASAISFVLGEFIDAWVILAAVFLNILVGLIQEYKAQNALFALRQVLTPTTLVIRAGVRKEIFSKDLVPGDVVVLEEGITIPADLRLLQDHEISIAESSLTGESQPVKKRAAGVVHADTPVGDRKNMAYMSTTVVGGNGIGVVVETGLHTEIGAIANLVATAAEEATPLQQRLKVFSAFLAKMVVGIAIFILFVGLFSGHAFSEMFTIAVAVAVAAIPEGLAVEVTVILAIGMQQILKRNGLVKKLIAAETLGSTTVICTDKTGTLTEGAMRVTRIETASVSSAWREKSGVEKMSEELLEVVRIGMLCNDASVAVTNRTRKKINLSSEVFVGEPTETALLSAAATLGLYTDAQKNILRIDSIPFSSEKKFMATLDRFADGSLRVHVKGAPEIILAKCTDILVGAKITHLTPALRKKITDNFEHMNAEGMRTIATAYQQVSNVKTVGLQESFADARLVYAGTIGMRDPLRPEVLQTIALCKKAGIKPVMITGDHKLTALSIASELGLPTQKESVIDGVDLANMTDAQLSERVENISVYARVAPKDKLRIVAAWQKHGAVVAMTGDGVNDAPALKAADVGVALGSGTDVSKSVADLVLLDNNFATIVHAVEYGRVMYDNIRKVALYLLSDSFSEVCIITGSLLLGPIILANEGISPLPLLASQILWINLVTDGFPNIALIFEPKENEVMDEEPLPRHTPLFDLERKILIGVISIVTGLSTLGLFFYYVRATGDIMYARTIVFATLGIDSLLYVFSCRTLRHTLFTYNPLRNAWLLLAIGGGMLLQLLAIYLPALQRVFSTKAIMLWDWGIIALVCFGVIIVIESIKLVFILQRNGRDGA